MAEALVEAGYRPTVFRCCTESTQTGMSDELEQPVLRDICPFDEVVEAQRPVSR